MKFDTILLSAAVFGLGVKTYQLSEEVTALKTRVNWTDTFMSKQDVDVRTSIHELNVLSDKIINTIVEQDKRIKEIQTK